MPDQHQQQDRRAYCPKCNRRIDTYQEAGVTKYQMHGVVQGGVSCARSNRPVQRP